MVILCHDTSKDTAEYVTDTNKDIHAVKFFEIKELRLWKLLLVKRPGSIRINLKDKKGKEILDSFNDIVDELNLVQDAKKSLLPYYRRAKYKLLEKKGLGFLFSTKPPPFVLPPSTVVIPSDKKGLLRALLRAVGELRAGNTSMQNIVVPLGFR